MKLQLGLREPHQSSRQKQQPRGLKGRGRKPGSSSLANSPEMPVSSGTRHTDMQAASTSERQSVGVVAELQRSKKASRDSEYADMLDLFRCPITKVHRTDCSTSRVVSACLAFMACWHRVQRSQDKSPQCAQLVWPCFHLPVPPTAHVLGNIYACPKHMF